MKGQPANLAIVDISGAQITFGRRLISTLGHRSGKMPFVRGLEPSAPCPGCCWGSRNQKGARAELSRRRAQRPELHARRSLEQTRRVIAHRRHRLGWVRSREDRPGARAGPRYQPECRLGQAQGGADHRQRTLADAAAGHLYGLMASKIRCRSLHIGNDLRPQRRSVTTRIAVLRSTP